MVQRGLVPKGNAPIFIQSHTRIYLIYYMTVEQLAQKLVQFESTHDRKDEMHACLDFCIDQFSGMPVVVKRFESGGIQSVVIGTHDTKEFDIILLGHIDTVPGPKELFAGKIENGKLIGRGTLDMKAFVATSITVMKELIEQGCDKKIGLMIVTDEELGGAHGARYLVEEQGYCAQTVLVPDDGVSISRIVARTKHIVFLRFDASGKEAHAYQPWKGDNAIVKLLDTYKRFEAHFKECTENTGDGSWCNTVNLGKISGGTATNEVPAAASMQVDARLIEGTTKEQMLAWAQDACVPGVSVTVELEAAPTRLNTDDPVVQQYAQAVERVTGSKPEFVTSGGGTDGRYFAAKGMRVIVHQGNGGGIQSDDEYVEVESLRKLVDIQKKFISKFE